MTDSIANNELLARYITSSRWFRKQDQTVKQDAFIPPEDPLELSVTRHVNLAENDIWSIGRGIARSISRTLHSRADVETGYVTAQSLSVVPQPVPDNPNHANIVGWPLEKDARKMCALEIARVARFVVNPEVGAQTP
ncbi:MAG: hypothetical protein NTX88_06225 [Candidatus Atribacteria bacterium]|nr:hypothetical protein [Candidatus Atribacteria bacterium]